MQTANKLKVAVLYGGQSAENEVSFQSGATICSWLDKNKYEVYPVYVAKDGAWFLQKDCLALEGQQRLSIVLGGYDHNLITERGEKIKIDVFFPIMHGQYGEDGCAQGLFEQIGAPYTGCDVTASAVGMDKQFSKILAAHAGLKILPSVVLKSGDKTDLKAVEEMGYPVFVKPVRQGSSVGVTRVESADSLDAAVRQAFKFGNSVMIEKAVDRAREIICAVISQGNNQRISVCGEVIPKKFEFFNYEAKYQSDDGVDIVTPASLKTVTAEKVQKHTRDFFNLLASYGFARVDFLLNQDESEIYFCEINTIPGYTSHSLFPALWRASGLGNQQVLDLIIEAALESYNAKKAVSSDRFA